MLYRCVAEVDIQPDTLASNQEIPSRHKHGLDSTLAELNDDEDEICHFRRVHIFYQRYIQGSPKNPVRSELSKWESRAQESMQKLMDRTSQGSKSNSDELSHELEIARQCLDICSKALAFTDAERYK